MVESDTWVEKVEEELKNAKENGGVSERFIELVSDLHIHLSEIERQNEGYRILFDSMNEAFMVGKLILDEEGEPCDLEYIFLNNAAASAYNMKPEQVKNKRFSELFPDIKPQFINEIGEAVLEDKIIKNREMLSPVTGNWFEIDIFPQKGNKFSAFTRIINDRKKAEEKNKRILENIREYYVELDNDWRFVDVNSRITELYGLKRDEIIGKIHWELFPQSLDSEVCKQYHKAKKENVPVHFEFYSPLTKKWFEGHAYPSEAGITAYGHDITERKKAEEALKESEELYRTLFENTDDAFQIVEPLYDDGKIYDFRFVRVNRKYEQQTGLKSDDVVGKNVTEFLPDIEPYWIEMYDKVSKMGKPIRYENYNEGTKRWYDMFYFPYAKGQIGVLFRDITMRKNAEQQLKETLKELERSNEELQQFAYVSSHDLQEPLRTIASFTQLLERRYKGQLDNDADEFMDYIVEAAKRMKKQIEGLLEFSRVGTKGEEFQPVDMNFILNQTLDGLNISIKEANVEIKIDKLPSVMGDAGQLQRVFQNLISNAIKFRKHEEPLKIHIFAYKSEDGKEYVFSVADNSIGIEEQYIERIFTIFQQLHTRDVYKGTGIGLSIVKRIIERHNGRVWVESSFGKGSTFYFTLPVKSQ